MYQGERVGSVSERKCSPDPNTCPNVTPERWGAEQSRNPLLRFPCNNKVKNCCYSAGRQLFCVFGYSAGWLTAPFCHCIITACRDFDQWAACVVWRDWLFTLSRASAFQNSCFLTLTTDNIFLYPHTLFHLEPERTERMTHHCLCLYSTVLQQWFPTRATCTLGGIPTVEGGQVERLKWKLM